MWVSLAWPDRFFPSFFVKKNGKKRSGHARLHVGEEIPLTKKAVWLRDTDS